MLSTKCYVQNEKAHTSSDNSSQLLHRQKNYKPTRDEHCFNMRNNNSVSYGENVKKTKTPKNKQKNN